MENEIEDRIEIFKDVFSNKTSDSKTLETLEGLSKIVIERKLFEVLGDDEKKAEFFSKLDEKIEELGKEEQETSKVPPIQDKEADEKLEKMAVEVITTGIDAVEKSQKSNEGQIPSEEVDQAYLNGVDIEVNTAFYRIVTEMQEKLEEGEELDPTEVLKALEEEYGKDELAEKLGITEEKDDDTAGNSSDSDTGKKGYSKDDKTQEGKTATYVQSTIPNMEEKEESTDDKKESSQEEKESTEQHQDEQSHEEQTEPNQGEQQNNFFRGVSDIIGIAEKHSTTFEDVKQAEENIKKVVISKESNKNQEYNTKNDPDAPKENDTPEDDR